MSILTQDYLFLFCIVILQLLCIICAIGLRKRVRNYYLRNGYSNVYGSFFMEIGMVVVGLNAIGFLMSLNSKVPPLIVLRIMLFLTILYLAGMILSYKKVKEYMYKYPSEKTFVCGMYLGVAVLIISNLLIIHFRVGSVISTVYYCIFYPLLHNGADVVVKRY